MKYLSERIALANTSMDACNASPLAQRPLSSTTVWFIIIVVVTFALRRIAESHLRSLSAFSHSRSRPTAAAIRTPDRPQQILKLIRTYSSQCLLSTSCTWCTCSFYTIKRDRNARPRQCSPSCACANIRSTFHTVTGAPLLADATSKYTYTRAITIDIHPATLFKLYTFNTRRLLDTVWWYDTRLQSLFMTKSLMNNNNKTQRTTILFLTRLSSCCVCQTVRLIVYQMVRLTFVVYDS